MSSMVNMLLKSKEQSSEIELITCWKLICSYSWRTIKSLSLL